MTGHAGADMTGRTQTGQDVDWQQELVEAVQRVETGGRTWRIVAVVLPVLEAAQRAAAAKALTDAADWGDSRTGIPQWSKYLRDRAAEVDR